jgi:hypothetical protein
VGENTVFLVSGYYTINDKNVDEGRPIQKKKRPARI